MLGKSFKNCIVRFLIVCHPLSKLHASAHRTHHKIIGVCKCGEIKGKVLFRILLKFLDDVHNHLSELQTPFPIRLRKHHMVGVPIIKELCIFECLVLLCDFVTQFRVFRLICCEIVSTLNLILLRRTFLCQICDTFVAFVEIIDENFTVFIGQFLNSLIVVDDGLNYVLCACILLDFIVFCNFYILCHNLI